MPHYPGGTFHSRRFSSVRQPGLCLSACEHAHPSKLCSTIPALFWSRIANPSSCWTQLTASTGHASCARIDTAPGLRRQPGCSMATYVGEANVRRHQRSIWRFGSSAVMGDLEPLWGMLMAHVKEEEQWSNSCVSGWAAGECWKCSLSS